MPIASGRCGWWQRVEHRQGHCACHQCPNGIGTRSPGAANGTFSTNEHGTGRPRGLIGFGNLTVLLEQHMGQPILRHLRAIGLDCPPADECYHDFGGMLPLPAADFW